jgi:ATP-dependent exoDNAse (exonuclease V) beta subunit
MSSKKNPSFSDFPHVIVVEASAGSGKTFALAKRYLELLINSYLPIEDIPLRNILAITFTNKATIEMKERILELLKKIALDCFAGKDEEGDIFATLNVTKSFARLKAARIMDEFIKHYNFFQVQTIDSFINALLSGCALNIDRSSSFKIKKDYSWHLAYCLDLVIEQAATNADIFTFLEDFLEHYLFVENKSGWFPKDDILGLMKSFLQLSNKYGRAFGIYRGKSKDVILKKKRLYQKIAELSDRFPENMNLNTQKAIRSFLNKSKDTFNVTDLPLALRIPEVPMNREKMPPPDFKKEWKKIHQELVSLIELDATVAYNPYIKLFNMLSGFFQAATKKEDMLFLEELNKKVRLLFDEQGLTVAEAYYRLATRFRHYLIDEFQDTSILQWRNLELMVEDALSSGGSLFYVGDKKQAIYRFRGGEARLFDEVKNKFSRFNVITAHLIKNWRSQKAIIDFNNMVFSKANLLRSLKASGVEEEFKAADESSEEIVDIFRDAVQEGRPEKLYGYVKVERLSDKNQRERDEIMQTKVINLIQELHDGRFFYQDIAILARDNSEVELVSLWLLAAKIPVESEKTLNVLQNSLIKEIICFLKFLHSPIDDLNFSAFILGEIFSQATGLSNAEITDFIFAINEKERPTLRLAIYHIFRKAYPKVWEGYFDEFFKVVGFISPYELLASVYNRFAVLVNFKEQQGFFMKFLQLVKEKEDEYVGLGEFLAYLEEASADDLYVNATHRDSVKVLTIHKAKGLEFPVVIIPFLRMDIEPETGGKGTSSYVTGQSDEDLGLLRITKTHRAYSKRLQKIYTQSYKEACIGELNSIYVALTRPQYELYIFIPQKSSGSNNKAIFLMPEEVVEVGARRKYPQLSESKKEPFITISASTYKDWSIALRDEFGEPKNILYRQNIQEGIIMHELLARIANCVNRDIQRLIRESLELAKSKFVFIEDSSYYETKITKLVTQEDLKNIFYVHEGQVFCEKEVADKSGNLKRIDRLIVKDDEVWIIDYKSSQEALEEQIKQALGYKQIIGEMYPTRRIRSFLVYLDKLKLEELKV